MEDALRVHCLSTAGLDRAWRLNPCSNGRCSARRITVDPQEVIPVVLILVLMEDALRVPTSLS